MQIGITGERGTPCPPERHLSLVVSEGAVYVIVSLVEQKGVGYAAVVMSRWGLKLGLSIGNAGEQVIKHRFRTATIFTNSTMTGHSTVCAHSYCLLGVFVVSQAIVKKPLLAKAMEAELD
jgi:hypothetical protein